MSVSGRRDGEVTKVELDGMIYFLPFSENAAAKQTARRSITMQSKTVFALIVSALCLSAAGCGVTEKVRPYKLEVRQGNLVTQEMISRLKKGMSKDQVKVALGTPLLTDVFHADRWDYVYRFDPGYGETEQRVVTLYFADDKLSHLTGDVTASSADGAATETSVNRIRSLDLGASAEGASTEAAPEEAKDEKAGQ